MGRSLFVRPETVWLEWGEERLLVKKRLTAGEQRAVFQRCTKGEVTLNEKGMGGGVALDPFLVGRATVVGYLLDWTLTDDAGACVVIKGLPIAELEAVIDDLEQEPYNELVAVVQAHEKAMQAERAALKKTASGAAVSVGISP